MKDKKISRWVEGPIMIAVGLIALILSLQIRNNPVKVEGVLNLLVQAKMLPIVVSVLIVILGVMLTLQLNKGLLVTPKMDKETWLRAVSYTHLSARNKVNNLFMRLLLPYSLFFESLAFCWKCGFEEFLLHTFVRSNRAAVSALTAGPAL